MVHMWANIAAANGLKNSAATIPQLRQNPKFFMSYDAEIV
jgi:hypothetical protein